TFVDSERAIQFGASGFLWKCTLADYTCTKGEAIPAATGRGGPGGAPQDDSLLAAPEMVGGDPVDGLEYQSPPQQGAGAGGGFGRGQSGCGARAQTPAQGQGRGGSGGRGNGTPAANAQTNPEARVCPSFDGKWEALIENYN